MNEIREAERSTPLTGQYDVIIAGGGPAGIAAALAAARAGASVQLIESHGCLGGIWTAGLLCWILDHDNKTGVMTEIMSGLEAMAALRQNAYDPEAMKLLLEQMCLGAGVKVRLHTRVVAATRDDGRIDALITESKSGREGWRGRVFIDCTGDGDLAARAGCRFELGRPVEGPGAAGADRVGEMQPMTLMALVGGVQQRELTALGVERGEGVSGRQAKDALRQLMHAANLRPSYADPTFFPIRDDLHAVMFNHEYGVSGLNAQDLTDATLRARAEVNHLVCGLRGLGGMWSGLRLVATADQIGVREGRRIAGRYILSVDDMVRGARFDDAVCRVTFGVDVHATHPGRSGTQSVESSSRTVRVQPYDIPLRALIAADCSNLLMAGRCISGDFLAHSSYRVTGNAVAMGEAAGRVAAIAALKGQPPHEIDWPVAATPSPPATGRWSNF